MPNKSMYMINPDVRVARGDSEILIESESTASRLSDSALADLIKYILDSGQTLTIDWDEAERESPEKTEVLSNALEALVECQLVREASTPSEAFIVALSNRSGQQVSPKEVELRLQTATITTRGEGAIYDLLQTALADFELGFDDSRPGTNEPSVHLVFGQDMYDPIFREANEELASGGPSVWLPVAPPSGGEITIGPWIYPGESACYECYMTRRGSTSQVQSLQNLIGSGISIGPQMDRYIAHPGLVRIQASMIADAIATHIALHGAKGQAPPGGMLTMTPELFGWATDRHRVLRVPRCKTCTRGYAGYSQVWFHDEDGDQSTHVH